MLAGRLFRVEVPLTANFPHNENEHYAASLLHHLRWSAAFTFFTAGWPALSI